MAAMSAGAKLTQPGFFKIPQVHLDADHNLGE
jgi:hypothetical protein